MIFRSGSVYVHAYDRHCDQCFWELSLVDSAKGQNDTRILLDFRRIQT